MKASTLDDVMKKTFRWIRQRKTAAEKEVEAGELQYVMSPSGEVPANIILRNKLSDKGRVRRIKEKVWRVLHHPRRIRQKLLTDAWMDRFDEVRPAYGFGGL